MARAASTNSSAATARTWARVSRMKVEVADRPMAIIALIRLGPRKAASAIARIRNGIASSASVSRDDRPVDPAAGVAGEQSERQAEGDRERHRDEAGAEGGARAEDDPREHVAPDLVAAERMREARRRRATLPQSVAVGS